MTQPTSRNASGANTPSPMPVGGASEDNGRYGESVSASQVERLELLAEIAAADHATARERELRAEAAANELRTRLALLDARSSRAGSSRAASQRQVAQMPDLSNQCSYTPGPLPHAGGKTSGTEAIQYRIGTTERLDPPCSRTARACATTWRQLSTFRPRRANRTIGRVRSTGRAPGDDANQPSHAASQPACKRHV